MLERVFAAGYVEEEGKEVVRAHAAIMSSLREFETMHVDNWCMEQSNTGAEKLKIMSKKKRVRA